ncbi:MAE_28990/MAE_18760 family HEPN-like nuclease [Actinoalloteichus hymeniacidonis]|uniref:MAE-28990/MAE-18760-like HEPN domain-containing protein n=1 Tax=Actinoalloteichus hymeniacidonis TaxID=340345 RepID=A0AAC9N0B9_9PSEU|nr:MAE_28990/MAE_18760 family HEPN-like nuclease [Actinoalloteichus hymeniacidonis]AOS64771.1 hypothetical protein TL08_19900 [Actinoalloteichus hymeniacidonis]MBB5907153.1 hypothetical protein [Actinoalloteichus hymeniacidonis]
MSASPLVSLRAALEGELTWRRVEIKDLRNMLSDSSSARVKNSHKRAIIVMLYAHLEGFVRSALEEYATTINKSQITLGEAKKQLTAACLSDAFKRYRTPENVDRNDMSASKARQVMRDAELVESVLDVRDQLVSLDVQKICSTDSNLTPSILRRNLQLLALDDHRFRRFVDKLDGLLKKRNAIAHGEQMRVAEHDDLSHLENDVFELCEVLMLDIYAAVRNESFRRANE